MFGTQSNFSSADDNPPFLILPQYHSHLYQLSTIPYFLGPLFNTFSLLKLHSPWSIFTTF